MEAFLERIAGVWRPHPGQREFLLNPAKIKVLACGRRWGKTEACAAETLHALHQPSPTRHVLIAPTLDQARLLFDRVVGMLEAAIGEAGKDRADRTYKSNRSHRAKPPASLKISRSPYPRLTYGPHTVTARSGFLGRALRGNEATHIVIDEAAFVPEELITEVAMPMLATTDGRLTMISTPCGLNHFWRFFRMGQAGEQRIWSRRAPSSESPLVSASFLEVQRELISERAFDVEYEAVFHESAGRVFRTEALERCVVPKLARRVLPPYCVGVDWARYTDYTAVAVVCGDRSGASLVETVRFTGIGWAEQVERVADVVGRYPGARVLCDATGAGDAATERLQDALRKATVEEVVFTRSEKARLIDGLTWLLERGTLEMESDPELLRELEHFEARETKSGKTRVEGRRGFHDDLVIALALACRGLRRGPRLPILVGEVRRFSGSGARSKPPSPFGS